MNGPDPADPVTVPSHDTDPAPPHTHPNAAAPENGDAIRERLDWANVRDGRVHAPDDDAVPLAEVAPARGEQVFVDAWDAADRAAGARQARERRPKMLVVRELVETLVLALVIFIAARSVVQNFRVEGSSMDPTYATGQYVLVNKALYTRVNLKELSRFIPFIHSQDEAHYLFRGPRRGEVIVFHPPLPNAYDNDFIKRVIGLPGDHVQVKDGHVYVNGEELRETYLHNVQTFCGGQFCDMHLGPDQYYVMGDNRTNSSDSRLWGPVPGGNIIGKTWWIYLPIGDFGPAPNQTPALIDVPPAGRGVSVRPSRPVPASAPRP
jgi:signal peptidase I